MINEVGTKVNVRKDKIWVDGKLVHLPDSKKTVWVAVNKPRAILTTTADEKDRETVMDLVPKAKELRLLPVGRLERDTTGLILLTNDNGWIHPLTHPSFSITKKFQVVVEGMPTEAKLEEIRKPFVLSEGTRINGCDVEVIDADRRTNLCKLQICFEDSQPWAIQRIMDFLGCPVVSIKRTAFGPIELKGLRKGQWRELSLTEIEKLKEGCKERPTNMSTRQMIGTTKEITTIEDSTSKIRVKDNSDVYTRNTKSLLSSRKPGSGYYFRTISRSFPGGQDSGPSQNYKINNIKNFPRQRPSAGTKTMSQSSLSRPKSYDFINTMRSSNANTLKSSLIKTFNRSTLLKEDQELGSKPGRIYDRLRKNRSS
jgi:23S rRNA pseudouridine2605 synthase